MTILSRMNNVRSSDENKTVGSSALHGAKPTNARSVLSHVIKSSQNSMKPASKARVGWKVSTGNKATVDTTASIAARKPRVPLSDVAYSKVYVLRDPTPHVVRAHRAQPAPPAVVADTQATVAPLAKSLDAARSLNALSDLLHSDPTAALTAAMEAAEAVVARVVGTTEVVKPAPLAGLKRRINVVEPARVVQAKVSKDSTAPAGRKEEASATHTAYVLDSDSDSADSQATVVEHDLPANIKLRKIAKPSSRAYSSLRTLAGQAAKAAPAVASSSVASSSVTSSSVAATSVANFKLNVAQTVRDWDDIDAEDSDNPLMVSEYITDIIEYLRERELVTMPNPAYMGKQKELTWEIRCVLVNWMVEIHCQLRMLPETLFLAVNILDRFLSKRRVSVGKFQLVGLIAVMLACKYEESSTPHINDFVYLAGDSYTAKEILNTEVIILTALDFDLSYPNPMTFLRRVSKAEDYNMQTRIIAKYLMEVCLVDHRLMQYPPSQTAAAGIYLGRRMLEAGPWTANLRHYSGYTEDELEPLVAVMLDRLLATPDDEFVFLKYQQRCFLTVSNFCFDWAAYHESEIKPMTPSTGYSFSSATEADYQHTRSNAVSNTASAPATTTTAYAATACM
ncbi:G2/mitotic-specific cyclin [Coemansia aciculifera]|uniref:G2/mitotic-specific cyclin n=1 Tax=Coemansia aciculifera TaxID=417176 RepID=A0A9W8M404_9FUNG|nr:G2/mitotic-specific cyclin [Coemansia aciculifera]KAJ2870160.1 G2/mitotic-specific cyclin [Coemansia aciculifera]